MAKLIVARPRQYVDMLRRYKILVDGERAATIRRGETVELELPPGRHEITARIDWGRSNPVAIQAGEGESHCLEVGSNANGRLLLAILYVTIWRDQYLYLKAVPTSGATPVL